MSAWGWRRLRVLLVARSLPSDGAPPHAERATRIGLRVQRQRTTSVGGGKTESPILRRWTRRPILVGRSACGGAPSLGRLLPTSRTLNRLHPPPLIYYARS